MKKTVFVVCLLFITALVIAYLYFSNIGANGSSNTRALSYIPANTALIAQFRYDRSFRELFANYAPFAHINGKEKNGQVHLLDSLFGSSDLKELLASQDIFISLHPGDSSTYDWLFLTSLNRQPGAEDLAGIFGTALQTETVSGQNIYRYNSPSGKFYFCMIRNNLLLSFNRALITRALDPAVKKISPSFAQTANTVNASNSNSPVNLFVDYRQLHSFLSAMFKGRAGAWFNLFDQAYGYASLNMNYRSDGLQFNGTSTLNEAKSSYTRLFMGQKPGKTDLVKVLPSATSNYTAFSLSNYPLFFSRLQELIVQRREQAGRDELIKRISSTDGINPDRDIKRFLGNEFTVFQLSSHEKAAVIQVTDGSQVKFFLDIISAMYSENIRKLNYPDLFYYYYGDPLKVFSKPFYMVSDNYLFLANSAGALSKIAESINSGSLLHSTPSYIAHSQFIANQSTISSFIHIYNSNGLVRTYIRSSLQRNFTTDTSSVKKFYGISAQWSSNANGFLTNLYAGFKTKDNIILPDTALLTNADTLR